MTAFAGMLGRSIALLAVLGWTATGCGGGGGTADAGDVAEDGTDGRDDGTDDRDDGESADETGAPDGDDAAAEAGDDGAGTDDGGPESGDGGGDDGAVPPIDAGAFTVHVPSTSAPGGGIAVRVFHPSTDGRRYAEGAPVAVFAAGGHGPGDLPPERVDVNVEAHGYVAVQFLMPGGSSDGEASGGEYDYRGPACKRALADVVRWAMGDSADSDGQTITDRLPFVLTDDVGVVGGSNGGNLALTTFADYGAELAGVAWFVAWESPIGDQMIGTELGSARPGGLMNPLYVPGTCTVTTCPLPGIETAIAIDAGMTWVLTDPADGSPLDVAGMLYLDSDGDGVLDPGEFRYGPVGGPGVVVGGDHRPKAYTSAELAAVITSQETRLFPAGRPEWLATEAEVLAYWAERDGSQAIADAHAAFPDLIVISLATTVDHGQGQPDHPHVRSHVRGWLDAGHSFVRLNPDAAYVALVTGASESEFPDNDANVEVPYPGIDPLLEPETVGPVVVDRAMIPAGITEASDRARAGDRSPNLDAVLAP